MYELNITLSNKRLNHYQFHLLFNTFIVRYEKAENKSSRKSIRMCLSDFPDIKDNQLEESCD